MYCAIDYSRFSKRRNYFLTNIIFYKCSIFSKPNAQSWNEVQVQMLISHRQVQVNTLSQDLLDLPPYCTLSNIIWSITHLHNLFPISPCFPTSSLCCAPSTGFLYLPAPDFKQTTSHTTFYITLASTRPRSIKIQGRHAALFSVLHPGLAVQTAESLAVFLNNELILTPLFSW